MDPIKVMIKRELGEIKPQSYRFFVCLSVNNNLIKIIGNAGTSSLTY